MAVASKDPSASIDRQRFTSLINSMADGVIAVSPSQKVLMYNGAALNILDSNKSIEDLRLSSILKPIDSKDQPVDVDDLIRHTKIPTVHREFRLKYEDGSIINLYFSIAPVRLGYGHGTEDSSIIVLRDITREKSLEEERDEFISVTSHELRTPVAIVEGNISNALLIAEKNHDIKSVLQSLHDAYDQVEFLAGLINDLSMLSRAERGKLNIDVTAINVATLIDTLKRTYEPNCTTKGLAFTVDLDPELELLYSGELYVREILQNFITNAIKYTEHGGITLAAQQKEGGVEFSIHDTGIGISKPDQEKIFGKFFRSEDFRTRKTNGTGLGLYVTKKLVDLLHAKVTVTSKINEGSTFQVFIPNRTQKTK